ncbi:hypothetical protein PN414_05300 [Halorubrum ezzemoulense]|nr:hypothetical protein [Halorubrum ezzemoulense]MDB9258601.1 hypothetical protein [Halorubrum ezzemoulense]MDB9268962.1 hypothetical protein [Halorubrum ezzemoulense]MDB9293380.1 hypothetical protein [Halorubrum ezzemoulense]
MLHQSFFDHAERTPLAEELGYPDSRIDVTINPTTEIVRFYGDDPTEAAITADADDFIYNIEEMR